MDMEFIRQRITEIRTMHGISEYQMSYDLGHSKNYIHNITNGHADPSVKELLYLIEYLGVEPRDFFDLERQYSNPVLVKEILDGLKEMDEPDLEVILLLTKRLRART